MTDSRPNDTDDCGCCSAHDRESTSDSGPSECGHDPAHDGHGHDHGSDSPHRQDATPAARGGTDDETHLRLSVPEMDCPSCAGKVERSVETLDGVRNIDPQPTTGTLLVDYDPELTTPEAVRERVESAGYAVETTARETLLVPEMDCPSCAGKVDNALKSTPGVVAVETQPTTGRVEVTYDPDRVSRGGLVAAVESAGYAVEETTDSTESIWRSPRALKTWTGAVLLLGGVLFEWILPGLDATLFTFVYEVTVAWLFFLGAAAVAGQEIVRNGYYSAKNRSLDIDFLMGTGVVGAILVGLPFEAATLAVLFSVAELLERYSMDRARNSLETLMELSPDTATVLRDGDETTVPVEDVAVGETVVVRPGEKVPLDGTVTDGQSAVDESPITGESVPVDKSAGDEVFAGSIAAEGYLEVETTATADESTLSKVIEMVEDAQRGQTESEQFVDRFAAYYTPVVVAAAIVTTAVSPFVFGVAWTEAFTRGLTLLVIACPCAFVISTPVSVVSGITSAARNGVLIKGGQHLEAMGRVRAVAFDKTGTLTTGELGVTDVIALNGNDDTEVLGCARAIEQRSEHPIATAIVDHAEREGVADRDIENFESITGKGVKADLDGRTHYAGKPGLFADLGFDLEHAHVETDGGVVSGANEAETETKDCHHGTYLDLVNETIPRLQSEGKTVIVVGTEDELEGVVAIADTVRPEAERAVARLHELGVERVVMLTGDNERTARVIGEQVGVDDVRADLLPEQKVEAVEALREEFEHVAMVGDGVNDAPALATATVGIAMGAAGTDTALETADVALMGDDLSRMPYLYDLSARAGRVIRQNIWSSLAVKAILAVGAPLGVVQVIHAVVIGDMGMSLGVTGNALRLANVSPEDSAPEAVAAQSDD
ncbi:heavy metal translocating P-type ATPase [Haloprofundus sp. MHR1]|uniref:heavy metal translocating P-type ATPase n=1 Tax=Haloprofundus sp. MHR1 TaxID=2572921 RepID=UPI0010BF4202|nr:heavy metal translocating P-type ATPase [Haloprofundus sp. MHR1]QCJ45691.1 cadmium-translocating P-type ATPase [Haloprofundus sp. MHR1]